MKAEKSPKMKDYYLPGWLFILFVTVFDETLLHIWTMETFAPEQFAPVLTFALGFGWLLAFLVSLVPPKGEKWVASILAVILVIAYAAEYFLNDAYKCFMLPATVLEGAGGVATDFLSVVLSLLVKNLWRIGLLLLPVALYIWLGRPQRNGWPLRGFLAGAALIVYLLGFGVVYLVGTDTAKLDESYNFDSAVRAFGLNMGLSLEIVNGSGTDNPGDEFLPPVTMSPPVTTAPPETTPSPETTAPTDASEPSTVPPTEPPVVYGENVLPLDFAALAAVESNSSVAAVHNYVASQTPSMEHEYTGLFKGKNLIFITAEAFAAEAIIPELTPTLYRLANEGIKFTDYYQPAWGGSTSTGEFSNLTGLVAANGVSSVMEAEQQDLFLTIGNQLRKLGYHSAAYHNHTYTYYKRNITHPGFGYDTFMGMGNGMEAGVKKRWPESDLEMMQFTVSQYIDKQPFSVYYMTVSGHCLYTRTGNSMTSKNYSATEGFSESTQIRGYLASQLELEYALQYLVEELEKAGIADDTVIVLGTDHYPYGLEKSDTWGNPEDYLDDLYGYAYSNVMERDHSALIIWSGCLEDMDLVVDTPVYSLDILPTLSNLFGVEYDSRLLVGRDVLSDTQPLVLWPNYSWKTELGFYNATSGKFTPVEGVEIPEGYVKNISSIVSNKITFSRSVQKYDYYNYVAAALKGAE